MTIISLLLGKRKRVCDHLWKYDLGSNQQVCLECGSYRSIEWAN